VHSLSLVSDVSFLSEDDEAAGAVEATLAQVQAAARKLMHQVGGGLCNVDWGGR